MKSLIQFIKEQEESENQPGWVDIKDIKDNKKYHDYDFVDYDDDPDDYYNDFAFDDYIVKINHGDDPRNYEMGGFAVMRYKTKKLNSKFMREEILRVKTHEEHDYVKQFCDKKLANKKVERFSVEVDGARQSFSVMQFIVDVDGYHDVVMVCDRNRGEGYWKVIKDDPNTIAIYNYDENVSMFEEWLDDYFKGIEIQSIMARRRRRQ